MYNALKNFITSKATQKEQIPGTVANTAGGYSFEVSNWAQFERFVLLGTSGGTYYIGERNLTKQNLDAVIRCIDEDGARAVNLIETISVEGRAPKNDPAIFALALASSSDNDLTRQLAFHALPKVCRTFTHLSHFLTFIKQGKMRGFGRGMTRAIARWFNDRSVDDLVYQAIKYPSRDGYSQQDAYRLAHPARFVNFPAGSPRRLVYDFISRGALPEDLQALDGSEFNPVKRLAAANSLAHANAKDIAAAIREWDLPMEAIPTQSRDAEVYEAVLYKAGLTWILRNLGNLTSQKVLDKKDNLDFVIKRLTSVEQLKTARVHPLAIFQAMQTYSKGHGEKGSNSWSPKGKLIDALDTAFYASFKYVEPSGKRILYAVDVSGSMVGANASGMTAVSVFEAAAVLTMAAIASEDNFSLVAFDTKTHELNDISKRQRLDDIVKRFRSYAGGGTDCALPFQHALRNKLKVDAFVIFTDSETWAGNRHPIVALDEYRQQMRLPNTKAINVAMTANRFTILPGQDTDQNTLECYGFDTSIPSVISLFLSGSEHG